ncbi:MAG TPA: hypothetical protein O0X42_03305 [Methanocorpusculum sp.]|nr:hypothetical protein [Methanocorpusculum sp.]
MNCRYLLPAALLISACVLSCGCIADVSLNSLSHPADGEGGDPILGVFYFTNYIYTDYLLEHLDGAMASPGLIFYNDSTGLQTWALESGEPVFPLPFTWKNAGDNIYHLRFINGDGTLFSEDVKLSDDGMEIISLDYPDDGKYLRWDAASADDPVVGVFSYSKFIYTDFLKDHWDGITARPGFEFAPDASGVEIWISEDGELLSPLPFIWENRGDNEYHICVLDTTGKTFTEDLTLSADGNELVSHYDTWNGTYLRVI